MVNLSRLEEIKDLRTVWCAPRQADREIKIDFVLKNFCQHGCVEPSELLRC